MDAVESHCIRLGYLYLREEKGAISEHGEHHHVEGEKRRRSKRGRKRTRKAEHPRKQQSTSSNAAEKGIRLKESSGLRLGHVKVIH